MATNFVRKNIDLPKEAVDILTTMAEETGNKFKPYIEWKLIRMANSEKIRRENPNPASKPHSSNNKTLRK